ncbi:hypothetical protein RRG08_004788 [Elysia crispata]|uniref:Sulfatase N-terminal domain-containing protein n=1 Tax=Elysia crispata TaxID=231223 RepID=A0AAE1B9A1_9GAST|nr:hypothetical protein RRG08_004788 [Elysia crispata]
MGHDESQSSYTFINAIHIQNGGWTLFGGNNFPLRGGKFSLFEGGTRVPAFVHSPLLRNTGLTYAGIIHAVDWFPTLLSAAGILPRESPSDLDGVDQWEAITAMSPSRRSEVVYNLDYHPLPIQGRAAIRWPEKLFFGRLWTYFDREMLNVVRRCNDAFPRFYDLGRVMF